MSATVTATPTQQAFAEVLVRLAGERPGLLVVAGEDPVLIRWFAEIWPERLLVVGPPASRTGVGEGVSLAGGDAVVVLDAELDDLPRIDHSLLLVSADPTHLTAAHRGGVTVCQAGWPTDLPALLIGALGADEPVLLFLAEPLPALPPVREPARPTFGEPRVFTRGSAGLVVGAGPTAPACSVVGDRLAAQGLPVTAIDSHTLPADSGVDASELQEGLLVGPLSAPRAGALTRIEVRPEAIDHTAAEVARLLTGQRTRLPG